MSLTAIQRPMDSTEIAARLGMTMETFYRRRQILHREDGMPMPMNSHGRPRWERTGMEIWFTRFHPARPAPPANDPLPPPPPQTVDDFRTQFARAYGQPTS